MRTLPFLFVTTLSLAAQYGCAINPQPAPAKDGLAPIDPAVFADDSADGPEDFLDNGWLYGAQTLFVDRGTPYVGYRFAVPAGARFSVSAAGRPIEPLIASERTVVDPILFLYSIDEEGRPVTLLDVNDDWGAGRDSKIERDATSTSIFLAVVSLYPLHHGEGADGAITLSVDTGTTTRVCGGDYDPCNEGEFCRYDDLTCGLDTFPWQIGTCQTRPATCITVYRPECGCDGVTYSNACEAKRAGASIRSHGECAP